MADPREPKAGEQSFFASPQTRPERTKLAHWPPPFRSGHPRPKIIRHETSEEPKLAKPRGWRPARALFSEFDES